jgi:hypothetical protein
MFGNIPKQVYKRRVKNKEKEFSGTSLALKKQTDCCPKVKPARPISEAEMDSLFERIYNLDITIGVHPIDVAESNNYMTFHDHYILHCFMEDPEILQQLTHMKENFSESEKKNFLKSMRDNMGNKNERSEDDNSTGDNN